ncbi:alkaline phosphatase [uncultured Bacteroides sp.]|uniref:alkaline phosphatase n=1 Tax=uncultured Bacteroides sp. TaxID=162156 RepID=UPI002AAC2E8A|nr:alkaline phosphatase [uncultured Bacteroides sp.]
MKPKFYLLAFALFAGFFFAQTECYAKTKTAKYVFYFIGDGMGVNQVNGTEMYLAEKEGRIGVKPLNFTQFPYATFASTYSVYNSVTCSAAAGTALAAGVKTKNGTIGMDSLHKMPLYSVAVKAKKAGKKVGITTSVSIDHATPATFYAHQPDRDMYYEIATDLPKTGFDFYAGSGFLKPTNPKDKNAPEIYSLFKKTNYTVAKGYEDFKAKSRNASKMILMQKEGSDMECIPYAIDRKPGNLTLCQITESAVNFLTKENKNGFFLMVEGGKIDWACHNNDAATVFDEVSDMADAVQIAYNFYLKHPDETLIVVTADHETGGIALGAGKYELNLKVLANQKVSEDGLSVKINQLRKEKNNNITWNDIKELLSENMGFWKKVNLTEKQEQRLKEEYIRSFLGDKVKLTETLYSQNEPIAALARQILNEIAMVSWASSNHTAGYIPVYAIGAGSELFHGKLENTDIPKKIAEAANY